MPTVFSKNGFRFFFYSNEGDEPIHIHVQYGGAVAKFWIYPKIYLASNIGLKPKEIKRSKKLIANNLILIKEKWDEFHNS